MKRIVKVAKPLQTLGAFGVLKSFAMFGLLMTQAYAAEMEMTTVTISPAVQEQIQKSSPNERKKIEAATSSGNKFIPHHFDGTAYENGDAGGKQELKKWQQNIRPLVDRDVGHWYTFSEIQSESVELLKMDGLPEDHPYAGDVAVCPQIELVSISVPDEHFDVGWKRSDYTINFVEDSFELIYRAKVIGAWSGLTAAQLTFIPSKRNEWGSVLIGLNKSYKISRVMSEYALDAAVPIRHVDIISRSINGVWANTSSANDKIRLKQLLQKMKNAEDMVCKGVLDTPTQPSIKE